VAFAAAGQPAEAAVERLGGGGASAVGGELPGRPGHPRRRPPRRRGSRAGGSPAPHRRAARKRAVPDGPGAGGRRDRPCLARRGARPRRWRARPRSCTSGWPIRWSTPASTPPATSAYTSRYEFCQEHGEQTAGSCAVPASRRFCSWPGTGTGRWRYARTRPVPTEAPAARTGGRNRHRRADPRLPRSAARRPPRAAGRDLDRHPDRAHRDGAALGVGPVRARRRHRGGRGQRWPAPGGSWTAGRKPGKGTTRSPSCNGRPRCSPRPASRPGRGPARRPWPG
jgi:hypothetical protein